VVAGQRENVVDAGLLERADEEVGASYRACHDGAPCPAARLRGLHRRL
jgi:hypothetical protein